MDQECVHFLQWALPRLDMEWNGFRKVRRQVCKRIQRRMALLEIPEWKHYREYLERNQDEWEVLDSFCRITISRFYRDYYIFNYISDIVISRLLYSFSKENHFNFLSLGCASGEEPYTLAIIWKEKFESLNDDKFLQIAGVDADLFLLERAQKAIYPRSSVRELPPKWIKKAFQEKNDLLELREEYRTIVDFRQQDIRDYHFKGMYHLVCCRNLVATYFSKELQLRLFRKIRNAMPVGGALVLGTHERLPIDIKEFEQDGKVKQVYWAV